jgi:hypothetical protein
MNILQLAGSLLRDPQFREWVSQQTTGTDVSEWFAAGYIRDTCEIESRKELATNADAADTFHKMIRRPFVAWRDQQENHRRAA